MICIISKEHIPAIAALEHALFDHPWSIDQIKDHLESGNAIYADVTESGQISGYLIVSKAVCGEREIYRIAVDLAYRNQGIARSLLHSFIADCTKSDMLFLEVRADNTPAIELYTSCDFIETGRRKNYYTDGETAVLMMKLL